MTKYFNKNNIYLILFLCNIANAQNYNINILLDNQSNKYLESIKKETQTIFSSNDKIDYKVSICNLDCEKMISKKDFILLNKEKKLNEIKESYLITYNYINSKYDENTIIRAAALGIFEFLKENKKTKSLYLENKKEEILEPKELNLKNEKTLEIKDIFLLASNNNFEIRENKNNSKIDKLNIQDAKSQYKPQIDFYSNLIQIDKDRAEYSNGLYSEGTLEAGVKLSQVIYSDKILKNIKMKKLLDLSNTNSIKARNDEILYKGLLTYLNIIKANNYNQIMKIKQNFIKQNLEFSKQRVEVGVQDRSDVYRWENEFANVNIDLANSQKQLNSLKIDLAELLQINSDFSFIQYGMNSTIFKLLNNDAVRSISNKEVQELFLNDIINTHSKLKQINELINVKNTQLRMNKNSRYIPQVVFEGSANKIVNRYGTTANANRPWDDNEYQAVINLTLPLYEGGSKSINIEKNEIELVNLKLQYNSVKSLIQKNLQQDYDSLLKAYEKISYAKTSLEFSKKNYDLIQDKYKNGKDNIISLLDAQNSYIISKLNENISVIDYLYDLSSIYFFSGRIDILIDEEKKMQIEEKILKAIKG
ncbi:MAG: TolC family protein [Aliarcobacter sp.]|nr:TolC family protein [Aliarcobacter sp.]